MIRATMMAAAMLCLAAAAERPNILFAIADDWSWPHASAYGAKEIDTPGFDRVAKAGVLFDQAFVVAPQCSPNRASILTGRPIWQLEEAGTHNSVFPKNYPVYPELLETTGYHVGFTGKGWSPGDAELGGWKRNPAGPEYNEHRKRPPHSGIADYDYAANFEAFLEDREEDEPFYFWYGAKEPHRSYRPGIGVKADKKPDEIDVPGFLPDVAEIREDLLDYRVEVEWFDLHLSKMLDRIEALGELENTLVVVTGDNGMPFPRAKANLYEFGTRVPFAAAWPAEFEGGRKSDALVSFVDLATTFLDAGAVAVPDTMSAISLLPLLKGEACTARLRVDWSRTPFTRARQQLGLPVPRNTHGGLSVHLEHCADALARRIAARVLRR